MNVEGWCYKIIVEKSDPPDAVEPLLSNGFASQCKFERKLHFRGLELKHISINAQTSTDSALISCVWGPLLLLHAQYVKIFFFI